MRLLLPLRSFTQLRAPVFPPPSLFHEAQTPVVSHERNFFLLLSLQPLFISLALRRVSIHKPVILFDGVPQVTVKQSKDVLRTPNSAPWSSIGFMFIEGRMNSPSFTCPRNGPLSSPPPPVFDEKGRADSFFPFPCPSIGFFSCFLCYTRICTSPVFFHRVLEPFCVPF